ncbi:MAG TPA: YlxR family protein [Candidatus Dormibacteraeota bacterium]|nr:YlxR family protein [Candidatus Dormibacteraeota bacterium]
MPKSRHEPVRTCVGCRAEAGKGVLIRVVRVTGGGAAVDQTGHAEGRGAYIHDDPSCVELARKRRSLERALRGSIQPELWTELLSSPPRGEGQGEGRAKQP